MVLVGHEYNKKTDNPIYWFIDLDKQVIVKHYIPKSDSDSCFKQKGLTEAEIRSTIKAKGGKDIIKGIDWITQYDVLTKQEITVARVRLKSAKLVGKYRLETSNEANIKREYRHSFDKTWLYGLNYDSKFKRIIIPINTKYEKILKDHDKLIRDRMLQWTFTPLPKIKRMALDIETLSHGKVKPDVKEAQEPVISCAFAYSDNHPGEVIVLSANARGLKYKGKSIPMLTEWIKGGLLKVIIVHSEYELLEHVFQRIRTPGYPLISTFYGLGFDMPYLRNRALVLGFPEHKIPIKGYLPKFSRHEWTIEVENKIHLDLNVHLNLAVIKNYVHKNKYLETSLDKVSQALIDMRKYDSDIPISEMPLSELVWYNFWDAYLTQKLTEFNNEITLKIIFLFMRIGRQSFRDAAHRAISSKIINLLYGHMIESNILIPTREDLKVFGTVESESRTNKSFEGAKILSTIMGVHIGTDVVDFSSLYPSQNDNYNISFETMNCGHEECRNAIHNQIPGLDHYSCIKYRGIMPKLIGLIKDIRVKIFKPLAKDPEMGAVEQALKVYVNAAFGVTGDKKFNLYCPPAGECYSNDTEVLTENGWKLFAYLNKDEKVASLSKDGILEYVLPTKYIEECYKGSMFSQTGQQIDLLVTPNHNMYVGWEGRKQYKKVIRWGFRTPTEMPKNVKYKRDMIWNGVRENTFTLPSITTAIAKKTIDMNTWLRFFGIWLAEGSTTTGNNRDYKAVITQKNETNRKIIRTWLEALPFSFKEYGNDFIIHNKQLWSYLKQFGKSHDKYIPRELLQLPQEQLKILFESMMLGDGWSRRKYATVSKRLANDFSELVIKLGHAATLTKRHTHDSIIMGRKIKGCDIYIISISFIRLQPMQNKMVDNRRWIPYNDMTYCLEVPNHLLYVRRNGRACWSGNSTTALGRYALDRLKKKAESYPGVTIIFGDTDSVGLVGATPEIIKELEEWSLRVLNIELTHEYHALIFVIAASKSKKDEGLKKNYFYVEEGTYKVVVKGLAGKKRQTPPIISQCFWDCLNSIANSLKDLGEDIHSIPKEVIVAGAREIVIQIMRDYWVRIWNRKGTIKDYRYSVQKTKTFAEYTASTPQHIKAALTLARWIKSTAGAAYRHVPPEVLVPYGSYIEYIKSAASDKRKTSKELTSIKKHGIKINPMPVEMATIEDICPEIYHSSLLSTMEQIMIPLGISEEDVVIHMNDPLGNQTSLDQFA